MAIGELPTFGHESEQRRKERVDIGCHIDTPTLGDDQ